MLSHPARIARDGNGFKASSPEIREALTGTSTREEAVALAANALTTAMDFYFEDPRQVPAPSAPRRGRGVIDLPPSVGAKVLLPNEMLRQQTIPPSWRRS